MKHYKMVITFISLFAAASGMSQTRINKDSLRVANVHRLSVFLSLSSSQESALSEMERQFENRMDSLAQRPVAPQSPSSAMASALTEYRGQLKHLFTEDQWKRYKAMLDERRAAYLKAAAEKHITVKELPGQE